MAFGCLAPANYSRAQRSAPRCILKLRGFVHTGTYHAIETSCFRGPPRQPTTELRCPTLTEFCSIKKIPLREHLVPFSSSSHEKRPPRPTNRYRSYTQRRRPRRLLCLQLWEKVPGHLAFGRDQRKRAAIEAPRLTVPPTSSSSPSLPQIAAQISRAHPCWSPPHFGAGEPPGRRYESASPVAGLGSGCAAARADGFLAAGWGAEGITGWVGILLSRYHSYAIAHRPPRVTAGYSMGLILGARGPFLITNIRLPKRRQMGMHFILWASWEALTRHFRRRL